MAKKGTHKDKGKSGNARSAETQKDQSQPAVQPEEKEVGFGILPHRNLKKNLGCG